MRKQYGKVKSEVAKRLQRRKLTIRKKIAGTADRPRLCVTKSNKNIFIQAIDDVAGKTIASAQTFGKNKVEGSSISKDGSKAIGLALGAKLKGEGISSAVFDRGGRQYKGAVAAVAEGIRESGIQM